MRSVVSASRSRAATLSVRAFAPSPTHATQCGVHSALVSISMQRAQMINRSFMTAAQGKKQMKAVVVRETGDSSKLLVDTQYPKPVAKPGQVIVRNVYCGLNFIDTYQRSGLYPRELPFIGGSEGSGVVDSVADDVTSVKVGDRVAYNCPNSYAEFTAVPASRIVPVPASVDLATAAACMIQGMTAHYLAKGVYNLKEGDWCLVHAAAGGTGQLLVQIAKILGAHVIGTASPSKLELARQFGADHVINYHTENVVERVMEITGGKGVHVAYDGVGKSTYEATLGSLRTRGVAVFFGNASGVVPPIDPLRLGAKSLFMTRPRLHDYIAERHELLSRCDDLFTWIGQNKLSVKIQKEIPLENAKEGHDLIEAGATTGKVLYVASKE